MNIVHIHERASETPWEQFWSMWPKKVAKFDAEKAWKKLTQSQKAQALNALPQHIARWRDRGDPAYIPHPATWLNGRRFDDELECALEITPCRWPGCKRSGTVQRGAANYCEPHIAAFKRGETP